MGKFSVTGGGCAVSNEKSTMDMANAKTVNADSQNLFLPQFCESFCDSGRILRFKNPVKYSGICNINHG
jgi:hypothetical protein